MPPWLPVSMFGVLLSGGGIGLYRILRFRTIETAQQIETAAGINESFQALFKQYEADYQRVRAERDEEIERRRELIVELRGCRDETRKLREAMEAQS